MNRVQSMVAIFAFVVLASGVFLSLSLAIPESGAKLSGDQETYGATAPLPINTIPGQGQSLPLINNTNDVVVLHEATPKVLGIFTAYKPAKKTTPKKKPSTNNKNKNSNTNQNTNKNTNPPTNNNTNTTTNQNTNAPTPPATNEIRFTAYTTGYGWPDNTPPGGEISNSVLHSSAGGTGTYQDPITLAVGHSIINGQDILDYPAGTKFYIPAFRRYFIVEDTCGDGKTPQNGPCHVSEITGTVQLDLWVGGQGASSSLVFNCENAITGKHLTIQNPAATYLVALGSIFNGSCTALYGDTVIYQ